MRRRHTASGGLLAVAVVLVAAGCGGSKSATGTQQQTVTHTKTQTVTKSQRITVSGPAKSTARLSLPRLPDGSILIVGCPLTQSGQITQNCFYTAGPRKGSTPQPTPGQQDSKLGCVWSDVGRNGTGALELYECR